MILVESVLSTWNIPRIFQESSYMCTKSLHIHCIFVCLTSLDSAFVIISLCSSFFIYKNNNIIYNTCAFTFRLTRVAVSCTKEKRCITMIINKSYIHCMIYIETKMCTVSHISGYGWIRKACSF